MRRSVPAACLAAAKRMASVVGQAGSAGVSSTAGNRAAAQDLGRQAQQQQQQQVLRQASGLHSSRSPAVGGSSTRSSGSRSCNAASAAASSSSSAWPPQQHENLLYFLCGSGLTAATCMAYGALQSGTLRMTALLEGEEQQQHLWQQAAGLPGMLRERVEDSLLPALRAGMADAVSSVGGINAASNQQQQQLGLPNGTSPSSSTPPWGPFSIADAAAKAAPAVVNIVVAGGEGSANGGGYSVGGGPLSSFHVQATGSGFIFDADGRILTNAHVVADAIPRSHGSKNGGSGGSSPRPVQVTLQDGRTYPGRVLSSDRVTDLAVVKIDAQEELPAVKLGSSGSLRVGEWVVALGSPLHLLNSVTAGIVSCVDRKATELGLADARTDYIQTDAAINRGNSGGPLINLSGEVIGISNMKALAADGVSFAIPIDTAKEVVEQLSTHGRVVRPYVGIKMLQLNAGSAAQFQARDQSFPRGLRHGILVPHVHPGSPAEKAGLRPGDVIVGFADTMQGDGGNGGGGGEGGAVTTTNLIRQLARHVGRPMRLQVRRGSETVSLAVTASEALP